MLSFVFVRHISCHFVVLICVLDSQRCYILILLHGCMARVVFGGIGIFLCELARGSSTDQQRCLHVEK